AYDVKIENLTTKFVLRDLVSNLENLSMDIWSGHVKAGMVVDLQPNSPTYQATMDVSGLDLKQAVSSQLQMFKQTIYGKAFFKMNASGSSFNPDPAIKNLNAKGFMKVEKPTFTTIDIGKIAGEALNNTVTKLGDKISSLKGKNVNLEKAKAASRYDLISSDFTIAGGKFRAPNFVAKAEPNKGIDFKGDTTVGIKDYSLKASWEVIDTYNVAHADLSVEQSGVKVEHLLAETDGGPVHFPITAGCTLLSPCYTYTEVPEFLGKIALANVSRAVADKAKAEFKQKTQEKVLDITKQATPAAQDKVKGLTKKLFGK
ncbi:MAG: hypothetical protein HY072_08650, partial [Deltaproteobacteria bacterium]|nr:hypothetical protein [Deltaproteobacteria bacterium]